MTRLLANKIETNWASIVIHHMMVINKKGATWIPYGDLVSKVLELLGFNVVDEEFMDNYVVIRNAIMRLMRIKINNGIPSQKAHRPNGRLTIWKESLLKYICHHGFSPRRRMRTRSSNCFWGLNTFIMAFDAFNDGMTSI